MKTEQQITWATQPDTCRHWHNSTFHNRGYNTTAWPSTCAPWHGAISWSNKERNKEEQLSMYTHIIKKQIDTLRKIKPQTFSWITELTWQRGTNPKISSSLLHVNIWINSLWVYYSLQDSWKYLICFSFPDWLNGDFNSKCSLLSLISWWEHRN